MDQSIEAIVKAWQDNVSEADLAEELDALVAEEFVGKYWADMEHTGIYIRVEVI